MKNKWNLFWSDYTNLIADSVKFTKKHWFGTILYAIFVCVWISCYVTISLDNFYGKLIAVIDRFKEKCSAVFMKGKHEKE